MTTLHTQIIEKACRNDGWQHVPWRLAFLKKCEGNPYWADEIADEGELGLFSDFRRNPDAWRLRVEGADTPDADWNYPVLVLEFLEAEITHPMPLQKRRDYVRLWWQFDGSDSFHLRVYRVERYGAPVLWLDTETIHHETGI